MPTNPKKPADLSLKKHGTIKQLCSITLFITIFSYSATNIGIIFETTYSALANLLLIRDILTITPMKRFKIGKSH